MCCFVVDERTSVKSETRWAIFLWSYLLLPKRGRLHFSGTQFLGHELPMLERSLCCGPASVARLRAGLSASSPKCRNRAAAPIFTTGRVGRLNLPKSRENARTSYVEMSLRQHQLGSGERRSRRLPIRIVGATFPLGASGRARDGASLPSQPQRVAWSARGETKCGLNRNCAERGVSRLGERAMTMSVQDVKASAWRVLTVIAMTSIGAIAVIVAEPVMRSVGVSKDADMYLSMGLFLTIFVTGCLALERRRAHGARPTGEERLSPSSTRRMTSEG
jgi:hypothetical protein